MTSIKIKNLFLIPEKILSPYAAVIAPLLLLLWAFSFRYLSFGDPLLHDDTNWYLYVGGQMLHGHFPYVDIWDRKPFGHFLLYAPFTFFGAYRYWVFYITITLIAWLSSCLIYKIGRELTTKLGAFVGALFYCPLFNQYDGYAGREAIFFNLIILIAFGLVLLRFERLQTNYTLLKKTAFEAMILFGICIEIKPTVVVDGIFLGCFFLYLCWQHQKSLTDILSNGVLWISLALFPTTLIALIYALEGYWQEWYFANVISCFKQQKAYCIHAYYNWLFVFLTAFISFALAWIQAYLTKDTKRQKLLSFIALWGLFSALFVTFEAAERRFVLAFLPILALMCAAVWQVKFLGRIPLCVVLLYVAYRGEHVIQWRASSPEKIAIYETQKRLILNHPGCLFIYNGAEIQDITPETANCHLTRYPHPNHLGQPLEQGALGLKDENAEIAAILAKKPTWISVGYPLLKLNKNIPENLRLQYQMVLAELQQHYHLALTETENEDGTGLYERN
ncbi:hypothetical protein FAI40_06805 [Acetobacteraceae bacterium]|nr:hypothetical protein FAI40_06805 [Acetobacteraceae bacterium]